MEVDLEAITRDLPAEARPILAANGYFAQDQLEVGSLTPRLALRSRLDGAMVEIGAADASRPTVLIFGSYT